MSRLGKNPISVPKGVEINISASNEVTIKGPKGTLSRPVHKDIKLEKGEGTLTLIRPTDQKRHKAMHGLYKVLLTNMVKGVSEGFTKTLELVGIGYRASTQGQLVDISVGYSHPVIVALPAEIKVKAETQKGENPKIILEACDNELLGLVAAKIRSIRKPEPYKGKGIKYSDEYIRRKAGKAAASAK